ncbi:DUF4386 domain-containing protein [Inconstantimicrobium mannanitabidum]|uniref:Uncharacterized protein n=1 Tax=Inconstantimicrobium mannanitabidum TaxID=1604901 RepID=A0ACB5RHK1_9CLOT|nr:DUF4386 domain-containing protein [Clostridium sp. TW13]GKX68542.1 hypothetical protein rsdtw13_38000 [Clostridium sp. TW13]
MNMMIFHKISGIFIILVALGFTVSQIGITKVFNYPQILRSSCDSILNKYHEGGHKLKFFWTCFALSSLMLVPLSSIFYKLLNRDNTPYLIIGSAFGIASGIFYVLGLMRWVFLADTLSNKYINIDDDPKLKKTIEIIFESFHVYCGNSIGESMGFLCMGIWISITGIAMIGSTIVPSIIGIGYIVCGIGIASGPLEWLGINYCNKINKISMKLLMILLIFTGIKLIII